MATRAEGGAVRAAPAGGDTREGVLLAGSAFALWGLYPFYFKALAAVSPLEIVVHRILWSTLVLALIIHARAGWHEVAAAMRDRHSRRGLLATTALIAANWFAYVLAVTGGNVLDASLGYFLRYYQRETGKRRGSYGNGFRNDLSKSTCSRDRPGGCRTRAAG